MENTILIIIYILSSIRMYYFMRNAHSKNGIWYNLTPGKAEILIAFCPIINTITAILGTLHSIDGFQNKKSDASKFFKVKKYEKN